MSYYAGKRLAAQREAWRGRFQFYLVEERNVPDYAHMQPHLLQATDETRMEWVRQQEGAFWSEPSFVLSDEATQELFDMLWTAGLRPRNAINEASRIEAVTRHLEDMRAIAFDRLKVAPPQQ